MSKLYVLSYWHPLQATNYSNLNWLPQINSFVFSIYAVNTNTSNEKHTRKSSAAQNSDDGDDRRKKTSSFIEYFSLNCGRVGAPKKSGKPFGVGRRLARSRRLVVCDLVRAAF